MKISVVTTFNKPGYEKYGQNMIKTFLKNWPAEVDLHVYAEDCEVFESAPNLIVHDLHKSSPELVAFKDKWRNVPKANGDVSDDPVRSKRRDAGKGFKWHAIRFAHKVYAIFHCARSIDSDVLMWMDADTICHSPIHFQTLQSLSNIDEDIVDFLDLINFTLSDEFTDKWRYRFSLTFLKEFQKMYDQAETGIFYLDEWHDSFVFDAVRAKMPFIKQWNWSEGLITGEGHPLINSFWGAYLDHLKGGRKEIGKSKRTDLLVKRKEAYWQQI